MVNGKPDVHPSLLPQKKQEHAKYPENLNFCLMGSMIWIAADDL